METRSNQVLVGSVVLGILVAVALFLVWLSGLSGGHQKEYDPENNTRRKTYRRGGLSLTIA